METRSPFSTFPLRGNQTDASSSVSTENQLTLISVWFTPPSVSKAQYCWALYDRAKRLMTISHQSSLRKRNICRQFLFQTVVPPSLYRRLRNQEIFPSPPPSSDSVTQFKSTAVFPHVKGVSEPLRCCIQLQGIRAVFKSDTTLRIAFNTTKRHCQSN